MDVIDFIMYMESCTKHEALEKSKILSGGQPVKQNIAQLTKAAILTKMFIYFKNAVHNSKPARDYIESRGLSTIAGNGKTGLEIGYNTGQFHHGTRRDEALIKSCVAVGLLSAFGTNSRNPELQAYKPFAKYCLCFALKNRAGQVSGMYFRSTVNEDKQKHYYLKEREGLYPAYPKPETRKLILTEAVIDAATLIQLPVTSDQFTVLACYGTNGLMAEHKAAIKELKDLHEIIFAFDNDEAGKIAVKKYATELKEILPHLTISTLQLPENEDINSFSLGHQPEVFTHLLEKRTSLFFSIESSNEKENNPAQKEKSAEPHSTSNLQHSKLNTENPYKLIYSTQTANYYVQGGLPKGLDSMKITLVVETEGGQKSRNKVDLYEDKQVEKLCKEASEKLNIRKDLLEADIYKLTDLLDEYREDQSAAEVSTQGGDLEGVVYPLTAKEREQAESFLKAPDVVKRLGELLGKAGIVGEENSRIFLLLIAMSHKMPETLHALIQGSSGSGKTRLLKQVSDCMPPESVTKLTRVSDKVLYNYPEKYFVNRLLCLEDIDGLGEEAEFAFRELQSNGELNSATSIKLENGQITSGQKTVKGPIASLACTTKGEIYEDNMSRVFLIAVDESPEQTQRIIQYQNNKAAGQINSKEEQEVKLLIRNIVRVIKPFESVNPYANFLQLPPEAHKIRRLNDLFISFIKMVTLLNQYQRKRDEKGRLITEIADIETALSIMFESIVLKVDELDGSLRQFYENLKNYLKKTYNGSHQQAAFSLRDVRQSLNISKTQLFRYANDLVQLEYMYQTGGHANRGFKYKVSYWDNYQALREKIKQHLQHQLEDIKRNATEHQWNAKLVDNEAVSV
jgi:DNA primase/energy-coupling factor transporter ATP-binding protein EcfA2